VPKYLVYSVVDSYYKDKHYSLNVNPVVISVGSAVGKLYSWLVKDVAREKGTRQKRGHVTSRKLPKQTTRVGADDALLDLDLDLDLDY
jgi:ribosome-interacting GTPase 1